jgi:ABC-type sugar transport system substrate-binding protein
MKKLIALMLCLIMAVSLIGCGTTKKETPATGSDSGAKSGGVDVGIVLPTKDEPRWLQDEKSFKDAIGKTDYTTEVLFSQGDSAKEKTNVETLINKGIKVLIICAQDAAAAAAAVDAANAANGVITLYAVWQPTVVYGDVNGDGVVEPGDASLILQYYANLITSFTGPYGTAAADVNNDGVIEPGDASLILQYYANLITKFPAEA